MARTRLLIDGVPPEVVIKKYRESVQARRCDLVLLYGANLLSKHASTLGNERWAIIEQVLLSAIEYRQKPWILYCVDTLKKMFPKSNRVKRLLGIVREAMGEWDEALELYGDILEEFPEDLVTRKRVIAVYKSQGDFAKCADMLNKHLEEFAMDTEAWHELGRLYINESQFSRAMFCFEEMLLHDPTKAYTALTYAELLATVGEYEMSRKYYCFVVSLDAKNVRALWGLLMVCDASQQTGKSTRRQLSDVVSSVEMSTVTGSTNVNTSLMERAVATLSSIYSTTASQRSSIVALQLLKRFV